MPCMLLTVALFALPLAARAQAADTTLLSGFPFQQGTKSLSFNLPTSGTPSVGIGYFVVCCIGVLLPGIDPVTTIMETVPLLILYEASIWASVLLERRAERSAAFSVGT